MIEKLKNVGVLEIGIYVTFMALVAVIAIATGYIVWGNEAVKAAYAQPISLDTVEYSETASDILETCIRLNSNGQVLISIPAGQMTTIGNSILYVYTDSLIECLYDERVTLEYNGEPVRRELTPND